YDHHHDQQRGTTEVERDAETYDQKLRHQAHSGDVQRTEQRQTTQHTINIIGGLNAWTDTRNKGSGFLQDVGHVSRVKHQRRVEVAEENDTGSKQDNVQRLTGSQSHTDILQPGHFLALTKPLTQRCREQQEAGRENSRNNAGHIQFKGQMTGLGCEHLTALLALGAVHGDAALPALHKHAKSHYSGRQYSNTQQHQNIQATLTRGFKSLTDCTRQPGNNTSKDQNGDAVTDTTLGNLLTQPHHKHGTGHEGRYSGDVKICTGGESNALTGQASRDAERL